MRRKSQSRYIALLAIACSASVSTTSASVQSSAASAGSGSAPTKDSATEVAGTMPEELKKQVLKDFLDLSFKGNTKEAHALMDKHMQAVFTEEKMEFVVKQLQTMFGDYQRIEDVALSKKDPDGGDHFEAVCVFSNKKGDTTAIINGAGKLTSLFVKPHVEFANPAYAKHDQFEEKEIAFPSGKLQIKATLAVPLKDAPSACVVLVHGSGPCDKDETVGNIKVFRDIAWGLSSNGIAVLRYEKRTHQYPLESIRTVDDETVDDAVAAVDYLKSKSDIDSRRLFVLGHSLGALMAPRIAQKEKDLAGVIICAGPTRKLEDIVVEQFNYITDLNSTSAEHANMEHLNKVKGEAAAIKALKKDETSSDQLKLLGAPATWWIDMHNYDPIKAAQSLSVPILIMQGDHDYQVTLEDLKGWQTGLKDRQKTTFKIYLNLGHAFTTASDKPAPSDYDKPLNVDESVITDICDWIGQQK